MIDVGSERQLLMDRHLIEREHGIALKLHCPTLREAVWRMEKPWEGVVSWFPNVMKDEGRYRMWYRAEQDDGEFGRTWDYTAYMESADGICWERPNLGLIEFEGSKENNLLWPQPGTVGRCVCAFKDGNPAAPPEERYKAIAQGTGGIKGIVCMVSADGIHWRNLEPMPTIKPPEADPAFDSPNIAFWDPWRREYVAYVRGLPWAPAEALVPGFDYERSGHRKTRTVRRATSPDFRNWSEPEYLNLELALQPREQFYTNATVAYERAQAYFMFPMRYIHERKFFADWPYTGLSDIAFLWSRDGIQWDRTFKEAWVRPGLDEGNWHERSISVGCGLVQTGPKELSLYICDHFRTPDIRFVRATVRVDGFVSVNAPLAGGEFTTPLLKFQGHSLEINYSTSAMGTVRVEIQDAGGEPLPGFSLAECEEVYGDEIERKVTWRECHDVRALAGRPVRLRFALSDADLYAFRFKPEGPEGSAMVN